MQRAQKRFNETTSTSVGTAFMVGMRMDTYAGLALFMAGPKLTKTIWIYMMLLLYVCPCGHVRYRSHCVVGFVTKGACAAASTTTLFAVFVL